MEELITKISGVVFSNRQTGFHVLKTSTIENGSPVSVRGTFPGITIGIGLKAKFHGVYETHPTYGRQFSASTCELLPENGRNGVTSYLSSHVPSIGPVTAARLYDALGEDLLKILDSDPDQIRALDFLTKKQADAIIQEWANASEARNSSIYLSNLGLTSYQIRSVYTVFGGETRRKVSENPYILSSCPGIGFPTADSAARKLGIGVDDPKRTRSMILFTLSELAQGDGHMYAYSQQILDFISKRVFSKHAIDPFTHGSYMSESHFYPALTSLIDSGDVHSRDGKIYLAANWKNESGSAECLARFVRQDARNFGDITASLEDFEAKSGTKLSEDQRAAFHLLNKSRVFTITGFPGTGKTTMISAFVHLFENAKLNFSLMSPTGIAAKRLSQVTGKSASTIHRALGFKKDGTWEFHSGNKYVVDAVIVDEMSMVDSATFYRLVSSLSDNVVLIMIGDSAQLPSVGAGYVLRNLMECPDIPHVSLTKIYRQGKTSDIVTVAHAILKDDPINTSFDKDSEFVFLNFPKEKVVDEICKLSVLLKEKKKNFQVVAPMYEGTLGVNNLNEELRDVLNPGSFDKSSAMVKAGSSGLYVGDRVMIVKNDYDRAVFNGDVGKITRISLKDDEVEVRVFDWCDYESSTPKYIEKNFIFKIEEARSVLRVAFACTIHKCQGQEYDYVIMPMTSQYGVMLYKNLIYTAITRAKKKVFVFGDPSAFAYAVKNNKETVRNSILGELIHIYSDIEAARQVQESLVATYLS